MARFTSDATRFHCTGVSGPSTGGSSRRGGLVGHHFSFRGLPRERLGPAPRPLVWWGGHVAYSARFCRGLRRQDHPRLHRGHGQVLEVRQSAALFCPVPNSEPNRPEPPAGSASWPWEKPAASRSLWSVPPNPVFDIASYAD